jgi:hypothetical protein
MRSLGCLNRPNSPMDWPITKQQRRGGPLPLPPSEYSRIDQRQLKVFFGIREVQPHLIGGVSGGGLPTHYPFSQLVEAVPECEQPSLCFPGTEIGKRVTAAQRPDLSIPRPLMAARVSPPFGAPIASGGSSVEDAPRTLKRGPARKEVRPSPTSSTASQPLIP